MTAVWHKQPALSLVVGSDICVQKMKRGQTQQPISWESDK